jgi:glycosyltransferase involved in cell wall biosynthesis
MIILDGLAFRARYGSVLGAYAKETLLTARSLARKVRAKRALVVSAYPDKPDQSTLWWFDQGILVLLAAAGVELVYATDASYELDDYRLHEVDAKLRRISLAEVEKLRESFDFVVAMTPSDIALQFAEKNRLPLCAFGVKGVGPTSVLECKPPPGTVLWHGFTGDPHYVSDCQNVLGKGFSNWILRGAPFPANRYYFPACVRKPKLDALLFGSKERDVPLAFAALAKAGVSRVAALSNPDDVPMVRRLANEHGLDASVLPPQKHIQLLRALESAKMIVNPITTKSHYSFIAPLALGIPIVAMDTRSSRVFVHGEQPAVLLAPEGDVDAWSSQIQLLLDPKERAVREAAAREQVKTRHDLDRFFGSAIVETLGA